MVALLNELLKTLVSFNPDSLMSFRPHTVKGCRICVSIPGGLLTKFGGGRIITFH